ncbi:MAG: bifunctional methylenetetrahydrofolate dehydrogenase/methenyltetrahydrofolate cyclohydrolase FolD [Proteobacteria bacterium]|nr:bifunctional methylenetetrahydrofolate dehydrogenase/methenyltetrahydrofolate cyclohydrolase FolD [Pseudomonadota bacterium]
MAEIIDGKALAAQLTERTAAEAAAFAARHGAAPGLAVVLVGEDPASEIYVRRKIAQCRKAGINSLEYRLPGATSQAELLGLIHQLNARADVHGILVQLPLPRHLDDAEVLDAIHPLKDVDGFHPVNVGRLSTGTGGLVPCTPLGVMMILDTVISDYRGLEAVVIGKSNIVGKPVSMLLLEREATVTVTHIETRDLHDITRKADIIVAAAGAPHLVKGYWVKPGAVVVDVGISRVALADGSTEIRGDCATQELGHARAVTPVPGGVGPMTIACLLANTVRAAELAEQAG